MSLTIKTALNPKKTLISTEDQSSTGRNFCKSRKQIGDNGGYGTGGRKNSVARVWVKPGKGAFIVNKKDVADYFSRATYVNAILQPFNLTNTKGQYDVVCNVHGGGTTGQAGAIVHGVARALSAISEDLHIQMRKYGLLTRDVRVVERKKYGLKKARRSDQFSKR